MFMGWNRRCGHPNLLGQLNRFKPSVSWSVAAAKELFNQVL